MSQDINVGGVNFGPATAAPKPAQGAQGVLSPSLPKSHPAGFKPAKAVPGFAQFEPLEAGAELPEESG